MAVLFVLGFSSGLPLYLTGSTLQAWLSSTSVRLDTIAAFSLVGLAYTFKFAWAPLLDRFELPFLGRRRGWVLVTQCGLVAAIATMGAIDPETHPGALAIAAVVVAVLAASQDVVLDAYNAEILTPEQRAAGAAIFVIGYRVAMLVTGTLALFLADYLPWRVIYTIIAVMLLIGIAGTFAAEEPVAPARRASSIAQAIYLPFVELFRRLGVRTAVLVLGFVAVYKFGDYFAQSLLMAFFRRGVGFEFREIATIYKVLGFAGILVGGLFAGALNARFGMRRMLIAFGILQACTNLMYAWLAVAGPSYAIFSAAVLCDNITGAAGTAVFVAFLMSMCSPGVSATQMALLTSLSSLGQRVFGPLADDVVTGLDWSGFAELARAHAVIDRVVAPLERAAVAGCDLPALVEHVRARIQLEQLFAPGGELLVTRYEWPTFFVVTALMAIPGLVLATVLARRVRDTGEKLPARAA